MKKIYVGHRTVGEPAVWVSSAEGAVLTLRELGPERSLALRKHSPTGFEWGYSGSSPMQLALAILLDFTDDAEVALAHYGTFMLEFIAPIAADRWEIPDRQIENWLVTQKALVLA